jgi:hypothetical protein
MCGPQTQLTTSLFFKTSLHVSAPGDNYHNDIQYVLFRRFSFYCNTSIIFMAMRLIYCFLIYIYTILRKFKIYNFLHKMHIKYI